MGLNLFTFSPLFIEKMCCVYMTFIAQIIIIISMCKKTHLQC